MTISGFVCKQVIAQNLKLLIVFVFNLWPQLSQHLHMLKHKIFRHLFIEGVKFCKKEFNFGMDQEGFVSLLIPLYPLDKKHQPLLQQFVPVFDFPFLARLQGAHSFSLNLDYWVTKLRRDEVYNGFVNAIRLQLDWEWFTTHQKLEGFAQLTICVLVPENQADVVAWSRDLAVVVESGSKEVLAM